MLPKTGKDFIEEVEKSISKGTSPEDAVALFYLQTEAEENEQNTQSVQQAPAIPTPPTPQQVPSTFLSRTLQSFSPEQLQKYIFTPAPLHEPMYRKRVWSEKLWSDFCASAYITQLYPINVQVFCGFIRFLCSESHYSLKGVKYIIYPALKKLNTLKGFEFTPEEKAQISQTFLELRYDPKVKLGGKGKDPLVHFDIAALISRIPDEFTSKAEEASLFLFSLHTGARAITCENITLGDIKQVYLNEETGAAIVVILERVGKGNHHWNHSVSIEGSLDIEDPLDCVYWLNKHISQSFGMNLQQLVQRPADGAGPFDCVKVWRWSREAMRMTLKTRLKEVGIDNSRFSFHSIRAGTVSSAVLSAGGDHNKQQAVLELASVVCGWRPFSASQLTYLKDTQVRTIVASRLIGLRYPTPSHQSDSSSSSALPASPGKGVAPPLSRLLTITSDGYTEGYCRRITSSEEYHGITLKEPSFPPQLFVKEAKLYFDTYFFEPWRPAEEWKKTANLEWNRILTIWGKMVSEGKVKRSFYRRIGREHLIKKVYTNREHPSMVAAEMIRESWNHPPPKRKTPSTPSEKKPTSIPRPAQRERPVALGRTGKIQRKRLKWQPWEDEILIAAYKALDPLFTVLPQLPDRNEKDCQLRLMFLKKQGVIQARPTKLRNSSK